MLTSKKKVKSQTPRENGDWRPGQCPPPMAGRASGGSPFLMWFSPKLLFSQFCLRCCWAKRSSPAWRAASATLALSLRGECCELSVMHSRTGCCCRWCEAIERKNNTLFYCLFFIFSLIFYLFIFFCFFSFVPKLILNLLKPLINFSFFIHCVKNVKTLFLFNWKFLHFFAN